MRFLHVRNECVVIDLRDVVEVVQLHLSQPLDERVEIAQTFVELHCRSASGIDRPHHVTVGLRELREHLGIRRKDCDRIRRDRRGLERRLHLRENRGVFCQQAVGFVRARIDCADLLDRGGHVLQRAVHRTGHARKAALHRFEARSVLDFDAAEIRKLVADRVEPLFERVQLAVPLIVARADLRLRLILHVLRGLHLLVERREIGVSQIDFAHFHGAQRLDTLLRGGFDLG